MLRKPGTFPSFGGSSGRDTKPTAASGAATASAAAAGFGNGHCAPAVEGAGKVCGVDLGLDNVIRFAMLLAWASRCVIALKLNIVSTVPGTDE